MQYLFWTALLLSHFSCSSILMNKAYIDKEYSTLFAKNDKRSEFHVDVVIIHTNNSNASWGGIKKGFLVAKKSFEKHGVSLNLKKAVKINIPLSWHTLTIDELKGVQDNSKEFYEQLRAKKKELNPRAQTIFEKLIAPFKNPSKTIFLVALNNVSMGVFEKNKNSEYEVINYPVGGFSLPAYLYEDRIPKELGGIITLGRDSKTDSLIAHEMAHKLVNASHEGGNSCPKFSGKEIPGILGYTGSVELLSGRSGRYHAERVLKSPFIYKLEDGLKKWNKDYQSGGHYRDKIYGRFHISPSCSPLN